MAPTHAEIVVVGGGLAGLCTARSLVQRGHDVRVLEARGRVGGRLTSRILNGGVAVDLGGQWHGPGQHRIIALASELGVESYKTHTTGKTRYEFMGRSGSYGGVAPLPASLAFLGAGWGMAKLSRLSRSIDSEAAWNAQPSAALGEQSLGTWIDRHVWPASAKQLVRFMFQSLFCCDADDVSLLLALYCLSKSGSLEHMLSVDGGSQERQFIGGTQQLIERLGHTLSSRTLLDKPVRRIHRHDGGAVVFGDDFEISARRVVIAIPPPLILQIQFTPELESPRKRVLSRLTMGSVVKCAVVYERPFWRERGLSGEMWSDVGPLTGTYDTSPPGSDRGILMGLAAGPHAARVSSLGPERRKELILSGLVRQFGPTAASPVEYFDQVWTDERWTQGGYSAHLPPGEFTSAFTSLHEPVGTIHWAGTETARSWPGYMEGAIESSERVVAELAQLG